MRSLSSSLPHWDPLYLEIIGVLFVWRIIDLLLIFEIIEILFIWRSLGFWRIIDLLLILEIIEILIFMERRSLSFSITGGSLIWSPSFLGDHWGPLCLEDHWSPLYLGDHWNPLYLEEHWALFPLWRVTLIVPDHTTASCFLLGANHGWSSFPAI